MQEADTTFLRESILENSMIDGWIAAVKAENFKQEIRDSIENMLGTIYRQLAADVRTVYVLEQVVNLSTFEGSQRQIGTATVAGKRASSGGSNNRGRSVAIWAVAAAGAAAAAAQTGVRVMRRRAKSRHRPKAGVTSATHTAEHPGPAAEHTGPAAGAEAVSVNTTNYRICVFELTNSTKKTRIFMQIGIYRARKQCPNCNIATFQQQIFEWLKSKYNTAEKIILCVCPLPSMFMKLMQSGFRVPQQILFEGFEAKIADWKKLDQEKEQEKTKRLLLREIQKILGTHSRFGDNFKDKYKDYSLEKLFADFTCNLHIAHVNLLYTLKDYGDDDRWLVLTDELAKSLCSVTKLLVKIMEVLPDHDAATMLQKTMKGQLARKKYSKTRRMIKTIQRRARNSKKTKHT
jgi:hypothetical protein